MSGECIPTEIGVRSAALKAGHVQSALAHPLLIRHEFRRMPEGDAKEEETEMFPRARALIGPAELGRLGAEMAHRRRSLQRGGALRAVAALFSS
jgi:hypothetical protein